MSSLSKNLTNFDGGNSTGSGTVCFVPVGYSTLQAVLCLINVPLIVIGAVFNVFELIVFSRHQMRQSFINWFLLAMAASDLLLLVCNWFIIPLPVLVENWPPSVIATGPRRASTLALMNIATRWALPIGYLARTLVVYLTVAVNLYRYMGLCHPFRTIALVTGHRALSGIAGCLLFSAVFTLPRWFEIGTTACWVQDHMGQLLSTLILDETDFGSNRYYVLFYKVIACNIFVFVIPFILIVWLNSLIFLTLRRTLPINRHHQRAPAPTTSQYHRCSSTPTIGRPRSYTVVVVAERKTTIKDRRTSTSGTDERMISVAVTADQVRRKLGVVSSIDHLTLPTTAVLEQPSMASVLVCHELSEGAQQQARFSASSHVSGASSNGGRERESNVSRMLAAVAALFLACNTLPFFNNCLEILVRLRPTLVDDEGIALAFTVLVQFGNVLITLNSAASLPIYWAFSSRFRCESRALLFGRSASSRVDGNRGRSASNLGRKMPLSSQLPTIRCTNTTATVRCTSATPFLSQTQADTKM